MNYSPQLVSPAAPAHTSRVDRPTFQTMHGDSFETSELEAKVEGAGLLAEDPLADDDDERRRQHHHNMMMMHNVDLERQDGGLLAPIPEHHQHPHQPPPPQRTQPIAYLDGLRGLAAFIVYMSHHTSWFLEPDNDLQNGFGWHGQSRRLATLPFLRVLWTGGSPAVSVFFILSGYVLSRSTLRTLRDGGHPYRSLLSATVRRPFRLFIPPAAISFFFALALQTPLAPLLEWPPAHASLAAELWSWLVELVKAIDPFTEHGPFTNWFPYDPPVWTMSYELKGSLLVFGLLALTGRAPPRPRAALFALLGLALLYWGEWAMSCFCAGVVLAANDVHGFDEARLRHMSERSRALVCWALFLAGWYLCSEPAGAWDLERSYNTFGWYWLTMLIPGAYRAREFWRFWNTVGALLVVYAVLRLRWLQHRLASLRYLGKISFSFYLAHIPLLWTVGDRIYRFWGFVRPPTEGSSGGSAFDNIIVVPDFGPKGLSTRFIFCQVWVLSLTVAVAHYATIYIDEPSIKFSRWVSRRVGVDRAQ